MTKYYTKEPDRGELFREEDLPEICYVGNNLYKNMPDTTDEERLVAGWIREADKPSYDGETHDCYWGKPFGETKFKWNLRPRDYINEELNKKIRDQLFKDTEWKVMRYHREVRQGRTPTDDIKKIDDFHDALANITNQEGWPNNPEWPTEP